MSRERERRERKREGGRERERGGRRISYVHIYSFLSL